MICDAHTVVDGINNQITNILSLTYPVSVISDKNYSFAQIINFY